jgi:2-polyprenyl-3-methyl-5-hydroxy-6-metoxy-1,4-benzoquinol methylase
MIASYFKLGASGPEGKGEALRESLLELLDCPVCHSDLRLEATMVEADRIRTGTLSCRNQHRYPVRDFVPTFALEKDYMKVFSDLRQSPAGHLPKSGELDVEKITREEFAAETLTDARALRGKTVLDAGCGGGRFVELLAGHGARIVGMDIDSTGLGQISKALADNRDAHFVQADLFELPFRRGIFDFIFSLGVLHHTPDPKAAFLNLTRLLKPGGRIAIWVYPKSQRTPVSDLLRPLTTRIPAKYLCWIAWAVTSSYGPLLKIPRLNRRLRSILYHTRLPWHQERHWRIHSFLDWYGPKYQFKFSPEELEGWFSEAALVEVVRGRHQSSMRGTAPFNGPRP